MGGPRWDAPPGSGECRPPAAVSDSAARGLSRAPRGLWFTRRRSAVERVDAALACSLVGCELGDSAAGRMIRQFAGQQFDGTPRVHIAARVEVVRVGVALLGLIYCIVPTS